MITEQCVTFASRAPRPGLPDPSPEFPDGVLATSDQQDLEALARTLLAVPEVQRAKAVLREKMLADPLADTADGRATLDNAVDEIAFMICVGTANMDFRRPRVCWYLSAPRYWLGQFVPGSRWGMDNPDNLYQHVMIDHESRYEIRVRLRGQRPAQFHYAIFDSYTGEDTRQASDLLDEPMAVLLDTGVEVGPDGSYTITIDPEPAGGRANHMRNAPGAKLLLIRHTLTDWAHQSTPLIEVERTGGPGPEPVRGVEEMTAQAVRMFESAAGILFRFKNNYYGGIEPNVISEPWLRGGGFGSSAHGRFELGEHQALVVTVDPLGARGLGFCAGDPWLVSCEHVRSTGSLNDRQAEPNPDGTYTFIVGPDDPGVWNWIDTDGLRHGNLLLRWLALPASLTSMDGAIRGAQVIDHADLPDLLPSGMTPISPAQRRALGARRALDYARRYTS